ncbi:hypothetical protein [Curtobacterium sp. ISL-83]|uniref:hypothetical protein n=1 Tax=Curtobacterium sp. ISL-83 TaxID=2819145 RepID=UPI001BEA2C22|nr:hypothetical protein [Curtobacterium sp. ISL-83]MBT2501058.1 hypothetical protein [Curtobacterium sp. ISL-83]
MTRGGGPEFPDVDPRFDVQARRLFGPFWQVRVTDTVSGGAIPVSGGAFLTGYGSVRRAAKYSSRLWLSRMERRDRRAARKPTA